MRKDAIRLSLLHLGVGKLPESALKKRFADNSTVSFSLWVHGTLSSQVDVRAYLDAPVDVGHPLKALMKYLQIVSLCTSSLPLIRNLVLDKQEMKIDDTAPNLNSRDGIVTIVFVKEQADTRRSTKKRMILVRC